MTCELADTDGYHVIDRMDMVESESLCDGYV